MIGDEIFSSTRALTQMKLLFYVSNKPAIANVPIGAPGKEVYVAEVILTYPPLKRYLSFPDMTTVCHTDSFS